MSSTLFYNRQEVSDILNIPKEMVDTAANLGTLLHAEITLGPHSPSHIVFDKQYVDNYRSIHTPCSSPNPYPLRPLKHFALDTDSKTIAHVAAAPHRLQERFQGLRQTILSTDRTAHMLRLGEDKLLASLPARERNKLTGELLLEKISIRHITNRASPMLSQIKVREEFPRVFTQFTPLRFHEVTESGILLAARVNFGTDDAPEYGDRRYPKEAIAAAVEPDFQLTRLPSWQIAILKARQARAIYDASFNTRQYIPNRIAAARAADALGLTERTVRDYQLHRGRKGIGIKELIGRITWNI